MNHSGLPTESPYDDRYESPISDFESPSSFPNCNSSFNEGNTETNASSYYSLVSGQFDPHSLHILSNSDSVQVQPQFVSLTGLQPDSLFNPVKLSVSSSHETPCGHLYAPLYDPTHFEVVSATSSLPVLRQEDIVNSERQYHDPDISTYISQKYNKVKAQLRHNVMFPSFVQHLRELHHTGALERMYNAQFGQAIDLMHQSSTKGKCTGDNNVSWFLTLRTPPRRSPYDYALYAELIAQVVANSQTILTEHHQTEVQDQQHVSTSVSVSNPHVPSTTPPNDQLHDNLGEKSPTSNQFPPIFDNCLFWFTGQTGIPLALLQMMISAAGGRFVMSVGLLDMYQKQHPNCIIYIVSNVLSAARFHQLKQIQHQIINNPLSKYRIFPSTVPSQSSSLLNMLKPSVRFDQSDPQQLPQQFTLLQDEHNIPRRLANQSPIDNSSDDLFQKKKQRPLSDSPLDDDIFDLSSLFDLDESYSTSAINRQFPTETSLVFVADEEKTTAFRDSNNSTKDKPTKPPQPPPPSTFDSSLNPAQDASSSFDHSILSSHHHHPDSTLPPQRIWCVYEIWVIHSIIYSYRAFEKDYLLPF